uniref:Uncharacterized protein n=1 Tax=Micrurus lemniscatus lemniscatus TaxID=129467 RepID=A0A2D4JAV5_MICLE
MSPLNHSFNKIFTSSHPVNTPQVKASQNAPPWGRLLTCGTLKQGLTFRHISLEPPQKKIIHFYEFTLIPSPFHKNIEIHIDPLVFLSHFPKVASSPNCTFTHPRIFSITLRMSPGLQDVKETLEGACSIPPQKPSQKVALSY